MNFMVLHWIMKSIESDLNPGNSYLSHQISGAGFRGARSAGLMTELAFRTLALWNLALPAIFFTFEETGKC